MTTINKTAIIRGAANINNTFSALVGKRSELVAEINLALVSTIAHAHEHGDVTLLNQWANLYPQKSTGNAQVMAFIKEFAPAKYSKDLNEFKLDRNKRVPTVTETVNGETVSNGFLETEQGVKMLSTSYNTLNKDEKKKKEEPTYNASYTAWTAVDKLIKSLAKQQVNLNADQLAALNAFKESIKEGAKDYVLNKAGNDFDK